MSKLIDDSNLKKEIDKIYKRICCVKDELSQIDCSQVENCLSSNYVGPGIKILAYNGTNFFFTESDGVAYPIVDTYADLPLANSVLPPHNIYLVLNSTGTWFINRKERGLWYSDGVSWNRLGDVQTIFADDTFQIRDNVNPSNIVMFNVDSVTGTALKYFQNGVGTLAELSDIPSDYLSSNQSSLFLLDSNSSLFEATSLMSNYLGITYTSHTHSQYLNSSISSVWLQTSESTNFLNTVYTTHTHNYIDVTNSSLFRLTANDSQLQFTSAMSLYQATSDNSLSLDTSYTTHTHSQYFNTSNSSLFAQTSNSSLFELSSHTTVFLTSQSNQAYSVGNGSITFQTLSIADSNGVSWSSGSQGLYATVKTDYLTTQSVQTQNSVNINGSSGNISLQVGSSLSSSTNGSSITFGLASNITTALQSAGNYLTTAMISDAGSRFVNTSAGLNLTNISATLGSNSISLSVANPVTTNGLISAVNFSAGTTSNNLQSIKFSDGNGISWGLNAGTITATVKTDYQSSGNYLTSQSNQAFSGSNASSTFQTLFFNNANAISWSNNAGSLEITHGLQYTSNTSLITSNALNTNQSSLFILTASSSLFQHTSATSAITSNAVNTSSPRIQGIIGSNTTYTSGSVGFRDLNGISWQSTTGQSFQITHDLQYTSNTSNITSNALNTSVSRVINILAATNSNGGGTASLSSNVSFSNANNFSFYTSAGNAIVGSFSQSIDTGKAGTGFTSAGNNIGLSGTLNTNGLSLSATVAAQSQQPMYFSLSNSNTSANTITFGNLNGVSWSYSNGSVVASVQTNYLTTAMLSNASTQFFQANAGFNGTNVSGTIVSNSISISVSNQSNQINSFYFTNNTTQSSSGTLNASSLLFRGEGIASIGYSNGSVIVSVPVGGGAGDGGNTIAVGGSTALTNGVVLFSNANNISFGLNAAGGSILTASVDLIDIGISTGGNTAGTTGFVQGGSYMFYGGNNITLSQSLNGNSASLSIVGRTDFLTTAALSGDTTKYFQNWKLTGNTSGTTSSAQGTDLWLAGGNGLTISGSSNTISFNIDTTPDKINLVGNTSGTSSWNVSNDVFYLSGGNNVTLSGNNSTLVFSAPSPVTLSTFIPYYPASVGTQTLGSIGNSTASAFVFPIILDNNLQFNHIKFLQSLSYVSSTVAGSQTISSQFGLYSNNAGTLSQISSGSMSFALSNSSVSATLSYPSQTNTAGYTYTTLGATTIANIQSSFGTVGNRIVDLVFGNTMSLSAGIYWLGIHQRQSTSGYAGGLSSGMIGNSVVSAVSVGAIGQVSTVFSNNSKYHIGALGVFTSTGSAGHSGTNLPSAMALSAFNNSVVVTPLITFMST